MPRAVIGTLVLSLVLLAFYIATLGWRAVLLLRDGGGAAILLGVGLLLLVGIGIWVTVREVLFGAATARLGRRLAEQDRLPVDDLPRTTAGRIDRKAADAAFAVYRAETERDPDDWGAWYRLSLAYDAAGDRKRARAAARTALRLERTPPPELPSAGG